MKPQDRHRRCGGTRRPAPRPGVLAALAVLALAALPAAAIDVFITHPRPVEGVFGEVTIEAEVLSSIPVAEVVFRVDDRVVGRLTRPPWSLNTDVGQDNVPHVFEVTATDAEGESATARVVTRTIAVNMEMDLQLQQLYVTATSGSGRVLDLPRDAFTVYDEGERQEIVTFERGDVPLTATLLVDTSVSMEGERLEAALEGATTFVRNMRELDEAALMLFSDRLIHSTSFSTDPAIVGAGLGSVQAAGGSAINDHLYAALKRLEAQQGRRVVILLSDGFDVESVLSIQDVLWKARRSQALVYWIRLREEGTGNVVARTSGWRDLEGHRDELSGLERLVSQSGGRVVEIGSPAGAVGAFQEILAELREQYVLGYYPSDNRDDGSWHRVRVRVDRGGVALRTREGYVDF